MTAPVQPGPQIGAPSSLENVPVGRLTVDPTYQRATDSPQSRRIIAGMVKEWNWALCQPLVVSRRDDGALLILDGQHRHAGAVARGDIPFLPCSILSSLDLKGEAKTFVDLNTKRQKLSQSDVFHGMLAAGDPDAKAVLDIMTETGWTTARHTNTASFKPGQLDCAPMLVTTLKFKGRPTVYFGLNVLRAAYPEQAVRQTSTLLKGLFELFNTTPEAIGNVAQLVSTLGSVPTDTWITRGIVHHARNAQLTNPGALAAVIAAAMRGEEPPSAIPVTRIEASPFPPSARDNAKPVGMEPQATSAQARPSATSGRQGLPATVKQAMTVAPRAQPSPAITAPTPRRIARPPENPFITPGGKAWCTQCEQNRSALAASACTSRFCKLRQFT